MCPDPQLLSIYIDGELPSPWKEKLESHLEQCSGCKANYENFKKLQEQLKGGADNDFEKSKEKIWLNLAARQNYRPHTSFMRRRLSVPLPAAAAAAAVLIAVLAMLWYGGSLNMQIPEPTRGNFILAVEDDEIPGLIPAAADMNGVLQYLGADSSDILIMKLPESRSFLRSGEPTIVRAADYQRR
jgi:hypothetical protein